MSDSAMTNPEIRLTRIDHDGQIYYSQFAVNLFNNKTKSLEAELAEARKVISLIAGGSEFQCEIGERNYIAVCRDFLTKHTKE